MQQELLPIQLDENGQPRLLQGYVSNNPSNRPFIQASRNFARKVLPLKAENWLLGSKENEDLLNKYTDADIPTYDELSKGDYTNEERMQLGKLRNDFDIASANRGFTDTRNANIGQGALDVGMGFVPVGAGGQVAKFGAKALTPLLGKKIAQTTMQGLGGGAISGLVHGVGTGLIQEDVNPITQGLTEATIGGILGGAGGYGIGKGVQRFERARLLDNPTAQSQYFDDYIDGLSTNAPMGKQSLQSKAMGDFRLASNGEQIGGYGNLFDNSDDAETEFLNQIKNLDVSKLSKEERKLLRDNAKVYYKKNLSPKTASIENVNVEFSDLGLDKQLSSGLHNVDVFPELINQIETGKLNPELSNTTPNDPRLFRRVTNKFNNKNIEYQLLNDKNKDKFYFAKEIKNNKELPQIDRNQNTVYEEVPNNIINDVDTNFNPNLTNLNDKNINNFDIKEVNTNLYDKLTSLPNDEEIGYNKLDDLLKTRLANGYYNNADELARDYSILANLKQNNIPVAENGTVKLYHTTYNKDDILNQAQFLPTNAAKGGMTGYNSKSVFFGADKDWVNKWSGNDIVEINVPFEYIKQPAQNDKEIYLDGIVKRIDEINNIWKPQDDIIENFYTLIPAKRSKLNFEKIYNIYNKLKR